MKDKLIAWILKSLIEMICGSCRVSITSGEEYLKHILDTKEQMIYSFWHNRIFYLSWFLQKHVLKKGVPLTVLISQSKDGEFIARVVELWKAKTARGSSSRGGMGALKKLIRSTRNGESLVTTPDGPRGPKYEAQEGTLFLSSATGLPIIAVNCTFYNAWVFNSWDKFMVPKPFSRVEVQFSAPIYPDSKKQYGEVTFEEEANNLAETLLSLGPEFAPESKNAL